MAPGQTAQYRSITLSFARCTFEIGRWLSGDSSYAEKRWNDAWHLPHGLIEGAGRGAEGRQRDTGRHTHRQGEREIDKDREREGETETQTESKSECVSSERRSRFGQDTVLLVQMASHIPVRALGNLALCFLSYPASTPNSSLALPCLAFESDAHMSCGWWCTNDTCYQ